MAKKVDSLRINEEILSREVRLVGDNVDNGIYSIYDALKISNELGLDLIEVTPTTNPPICKLEDYNKFLYNKKKKEKDLEKKNKLNQVEVKELRFGPNTDDHDFNFKLNHAISFLKNGDKVKAYVVFKGREITFKNKGELILLRLADGTSDIGVVESMPKMEGYKMFITIKPKK